MHVSSIVFNTSKGVTLNLLYHHSSELLLNRTKRMYICVTEAMPPGSIIRQHYNSNAKMPISTNSKLNNNTFYVICSRWYTTHQNFKLHIYKAVFKLFVLPDTEQTALVSPQSITNYLQPEHVHFLNFFYHYSAAIL